MITHSNLLAQIMSILKLSNSNIKLSADLIYPVGSIYMSVNSTNPSTLFGGTWEQIKDKFLLSCGDTYANGSTGGSASHNHKYGAMVTSYYSASQLLGDGSNETGLIDYKKDGSYTVSSHTYIDQKTHTLNSGMTTSSKGVTADKRLLQANTTTVSNLPPYLAVYVWKRTK